MMHHFRTLRWSVWLAWQIESNWTRPWLFALYVLVKPLTASLLLVCMYWAAQVATGGQAPLGYLPFLYIGSACYLWVGGITFGMTAAVVADRDQYGMLKYVRISPVRLPTYLIGRGLSQGLQASFGVLLALLVGLAFLPEIRAVLGRAGIAWGWLLLYLLVGIVMLASLGLILAGSVLNLSRYGMFLSDGLAGGLYLLSGVVFPITTLPAWLQPVSLVLPTTYWLEGMRRALLGPNELPTPLNDWQHEHLALMLGVSTLGLSLFARWFFHWCERRAWRLGRFDDNAGY